LTNRKKTGTGGELLAAEFLKNRGYRILATNFRPPMTLWRGEIDIVASDGPVICFVEVKTRRTSTADPTESVTRAKRQQLIALAEAYLAVTKTAKDAECRFDVVAITIGSDDAYQTVKLYQNAFWPE